MSIDWSNPFAITDWSVLSWPERFELINPMFWRLSYYFYYNLVILEQLLLLAPQLQEQLGKNCLQILSLIQGYFHYRSILTRFISKSSKNQIQKPHQVKKKIKINFKCHLLRSSCYLWSYYGDYYDWQNQLST